MGATLVTGGATFRVWTPHAKSVHVIGEFNQRQRNDASLLNKDSQGFWRGFIPREKDRQRYLFLCCRGGQRVLTRAATRC